MPSCLGFYTDKNMIKYAKVNRDKTSGMYMLEAYGVKFYDNIITTIDEIAQEVGMEQCTVSLTMMNEGYHAVEVFSGLKSKDRDDLVRSEFDTFCEQKGLVSTALELRYQLVHNTGNIDKYVALCSYVSKGELANSNTNFEGFKISSIAPLGLSVGNLFNNKGIDEEAAIINIENKTTITILLRNEIQDVIEIPLGMEDILDKLAEKYNSYAKAYEACKKISVYIDDVTALDEESRDILDVVLPVLYDIRQRADEIIAPYKRLIKTVYISGSAVTINNVDLYFQENFPSMRVENVKPFFLSQQDKATQNEIIEVNSAIAIALNGLGMVDPDIDFSGAAKKVMRANPLKDVFEKVNLKAKITDIKASFKEFGENIKSKALTPKRARGGIGTQSPIQQALDKIKGLLGKGGKGKVRVAFDAEVRGQGDYSGIDSGEVTESSPIDTWLVRLFVACLSVFLIYFVLAAYTTHALETKLAESDKVIATVESNIKRAEADADYIKNKTAEYSSKIAKLEEVMEVIATEKRKSSFDIPNFMSQVMFVIPQGVSITNIVINDMGEVEIYAVSSQYAQLGYFVSRLKLEKILLNVNMTVLEMEQNIKIKVGGVLP